MIKILLRRLGLAAIVGAAIIGVGWGLTTQSGSVFLADSSAILVKSWGEVFGGTGNGIAPVALASPDLVSASTSASDGASSAATVPSPTVKVCWSNEQADLAHLAGLLQDSNTALADLSGELASASASASGTCAAAAATDAVDVASSSAPLDDAAQSIDAGSDADASGTPADVLPAQCPLPDGPVSPGRLF